MWLLTTNPSWRATDASDDKFSLVFTPPHHPITWFLGKRNETISIYGLGLTNASSTSHTRRLQCLLHHLVQHTHTHRIGFYSYQKLRTNREGDGGTRGRGDHDEETGPGPLRQLEAGDGRHRAVRRGDRMHGLCHHITALGV